MSYENQGTGYDAGAAGHERQGRSDKPDAHITWEMDAPVYTVLSDIGEPIAGGFLDRDEAIACAVRMDAREVLATRTLNRIVWQTPEIA